MQGIKFNTQAIQAILDGRKTMFRMPLSPQQIFERVHHMTENEVSKYKVGETVFVQEEFCTFPIHNIMYVSELSDDECYENYSWKQPCEMQEKHARTFLKITNIKVERLQDISEEDCIKEGGQWIGGEQLHDSGDYSDSYFYYGDLVDGWVNKEETCHISAFENEIWNNLPYKAPHDWQSNPYVFVYEFEEDALKGEEKFMERLQPDYFEEPKPVERITREMLDNAVSCGDMKLVQEYAYILLEANQKDNQCES